MLLTGLAWGIWNFSSPSKIIRLALVYVFIHFLAVSLLVATAAYFFVGRLLGPGIAGLPGRRRQQGLFVQAEDREQLEFGYCFDVSKSQDKPSEPADWAILGGYKSFLSCLGSSICDTVHTVVLHIQAKLVRLLITPVPMYSTDLQQDIPLLR